MKILVVCEQFCNGGLETQIKTIAENLPKDTEMVFAFGKYTGEIELPNCTIYTGFHFSYIDTIKEICEDVEKLINVIESEEIDVIHVHPYYSFFSALFASQITHTKLFYSFHGISSFNFLKTVSSTAVFQYAFESGAIANTFAVSQDGINCMNNLSSNKVIFLPNPIDLNVFKIANVCQSRKWALISRLDEDKTGDIKMLINDLDKFEIDELDIYGSGTEMENLQTFIDEVQLHDKVVLKGYCKDIYHTLNNNYRGVIGTDRVLIEAMAMGYPTIIIGYNKINGFVNKKIFDLIKTNNFNNIHLSMQNYIMPNEEEIVTITNEVRTNYSSTKIVVSYIETIKSSDSTFMQNICNLYLEIKKLSENPSINMCSFQKERLVYDLIYTYIGKYTLTKETSNLFAQANLTYELYDLLTNRLLELKGIIKDDEN